jgi:hypothetical protein
MAGERRFMLCGIAAKRFMCRRHASYQKSRFALTDEALSLRSNMKQRRSASL